MFFLQVKTVAKIVLDKILLSVERDFFIFLPVFYCKYRENAPFCLDYQDLLVYNTKVKLAIDRAIRVP